MKFEQWTTHYQTTSRLIERREPLTIKEYVKGFLEWPEPLIFSTHASDALLFYNELSWLKQGAPYYNLHPSILEPAARLKMDKLTVDLIDVPRDFSVINVRLPVGYHSVIKTLLASKDKDGFYLYAQCHSSTSGAVGHLALIISPDDLASGLSIKDFLDNRLDHSLATAADDATLLVEGLRYYLVTKFLADTPNDDLIEYDVLSRHRREYPTAPEERRRTIRAEAKKQGKIGWNLGVSSKIVNDVPLLSNCNESQSSRGELSYSHVRTGHLHTVRFGPGRRDVKVMFFRPTRVRPDLPFK